MRAPSPGGDRDLGRRGRRHRRRRPIGRQPDLGRPHASRHRLDAGHRSARREAAQAGERDGPDRARVDRRTARQGQEPKGDRGDGSLAQARAGGAQRGQPAERRRQGCALQGRPDRLRVADPGLRARRAQRGRGEHDHRRCPTRPRRRSRGVRGRLSRPGRVQAEHRVQRADRDRGGDRDPAPGVGDRRLDGDPDRRRDHRRGYRPERDRPPRSPDRGALGGADAGDDDRARGGDRLLAVHRHPLPAPARGRPRRRGGDRPLGGDLGQRGGVRRGAPSSSLCSR